MAGGGGASIDAISWLPHKSGDGAYGVLAQGSVHLEGSFSY